MLISALILITLPALIKEWSQDLLRLLFPAYCPGCHELLVAGEQFCCLGCEAQLPYTAMKLSDEANEVRAIFDGRVAISGAISLLYFNKEGLVRELLHEMKYGGLYRTAVLMGHELGRQLDVHFDFIVPVPMHRSKINKRGFNQSQLIAEGVSAETQRPVVKALRRRRRGSSQTEKNRYQRWKAVKELYAISKSVDLNGKRVLLVDDILTTGVTLEFCASLLVEAGAEVFIAVLGFGERL